MKQRGIIAPGYIWLVGSIAVLGLLYLGAREAASYLNGIRAEAKKAGQDECDAAYKTRDNDQLKAALARVKKLEDAARETERAHSSALAAITEKLNKEKRDAQETEKRLRAAIATGELVRRESAFQGGGCPAEGDRSAPRSARPTPARSDGTNTCKLSPEAEGRILEIGSDADRAARNLAAAQQIILEDRRVCGQRSP